MPVWEERSRIRIDTAFSQVKDELASDISQIQRYFDQPSEVGYAKLVAAIGGTTSSSRGSGTKTALIAAALTWMFRKEHPAKVLAIAANALGSDTDTIATMAGAIAGAVAKESPKSPILDRAYIETEAVRLYELSCGQATDSFAYPDLLRWCPPRRQLDAVGKVGNRVSLAGLALVKTTGKTYDGRSKDIVWQWAELDFG